MIKFKTSVAERQIGDCTIEKYYKIQEWLTLSDQRDPQVKMISILSGASEDEIRGLESAEFEKIWYWASIGPLSALTDTAFRNRIEVAGQEFAFLNLKTLSIGELADMDTLKAHPQVDKQLHKMMAILYRPIGPDGKPVPHTSEGFEERAELFLHEMSVAPVVAAIDFFFHITKVSLNSMMDSLAMTLKGMMQEMTEQDKNALIKKLQEDGVDYSGSWLETIS